MLAKAGATVSFHADLGGIPTPETLELEWRVVGGKILERSNSQISVELDTEPGFFTASAQVNREGTPIGFGTRTGISLSVEDSARLDLMVTLREMAAPDEPAGPLVNLTSSMNEQMALFTSVHFPILEERTERVEQALARLSAARSAPPENGKSN
jgi:hypothetical protein